MRLFFVNSTFFAVVMQFWITTQIHKQLRTSSAHRNHKRNVNQSTEPSLNQTSESTRTSNKNSALALIVCVSLFAAQLILLFMRLSDGITWLWALVLIPTWALFVVLVGIWTQQIHVAVKLKPTAHKEITSTLLSRRNYALALSTTQWVCLLTFVILLTLRLDVAAFHHWLWSLVAIPLWVLIVVWFVTTILPDCQMCDSTDESNDQDTQSLEIDDDDDDDNQNVSRKSDSLTDTKAVLQYTVAIAGTLSFLSVSTLLALILVRLDVPSLQWSWIAVIVPPTSVWFITQMTWWCGQLVLKLYATRVSTISYGSSWFVLIIEFVTLVALAVFVGVLVAYLDSDLNASFLAPLFWPLFLYCFLVILICWFPNYFD